MVAGAAVLPPGGEPGGRSAVVPGRAAAVLVRATGAAILLVALIASVHPHMGLLGFRGWLVAPAMVLVVGAALLVRTSRGRSLPGRRATAAVAIGGAVLSTLVAAHLFYGFSWDARSLWNFARITAQGDELPPHAYDYLSLYPNTIAMVGIDRGYLAVAEVLGLRPGAVVVLANGVALGTTLYAVGSLVRRGAGTRAALLAQLLVLALVGLSPWMSVPYTDIPAMPFVAGGVALAARALEPARAGDRPWLRATLWCLAALAIAVAYVVKSTPAVVLVAVVLMLGVVVARPASPTRAARGMVHRAARGALAGVVLLVVFVVGAATVSAAAASVAGVDTSRIDRGVTPPLGWWLANGMNEQPNQRGGTSYGTYDRSMVEAIKGRSQDEARAYAQGFIDERWRERGPLGTAGFYAAKTVWNWGDGMFWAWGEGGDLHVEEPAHDGPLPDLAWSLSNPHGAAYPLRADLTQAVWLAVLVLVGLGALVARPRRNLLLLLLILLGAAAFTLLFQGRSRYVLVFAPAAVAAASLTLAETRQWAQHHVNRLKGSWTDH
ncbi:hypothetical protein ACOCJ5_14675 [Knoellia sp. CPCC 206450]|uniref:hypothetical protein n=1 Tax=Knoellia tibetensis TaxID=3404798 RepID=UPI003B42CB7D